MIPCSCTKERKGKKERKRERKQGAQSGFIAARFGLDSKKRKNEGMNEGTREEVKQRDRR